MQIGVTQLGVRRKILEAIRGVHTNEWDYTGLAVDNTSKLRYFCGVFACSVFSVVDTWGKAIGCDLEQRGYWHVA